MNFKKSWLVDFDNHDRLAFPEGIVRVTAGRGGESLLIFGPEKTVLYDCGMAFCADGLIKNIESALKERNREKVDFLVLSHTHYDHIGALPLLREKWPNILVLGALKAKQVFESEGAKKTITELSKSASKLYLGKDIDIPTEGMYVDEVLVDGQKIDLGGSEFLEVLETKGHTDCSLAFIRQPGGIMLASETTGVLENPNSIHVPALKGFEDSIKSAIKCREKKPKLIINPHYGVLPDHYTDIYFDFFLKNAEELKQFIIEKKNLGLSFDEILKEYEEDVWTPEREAEQPWEAFVINSKNIVATILKELS